MRPPASFKDQFLYNRKERYAILLLSLLLLSIIVIGEAYIYVKRTSIDSGKLLVKLEDYRDNEAIANNDIGQQSKSKSKFKFDKNNTFQKAAPKPEKIKEVFPEIVRFDFDPNNVSFDELIKLGVNKSSAKIWLNYLNKGGRFYDDFDIGKIYGIDQTMLNTLLPYVKISNDQKRDTYEFAMETDQIDRAAPKLSANKININTADQDALEELYGVGPYYAEQIIKLRTKLGGIHELEQLKQIYKMRDETIDKLVDQVIIMQEDIKKIDLNQAVEEELTKLPYISAKQAKTILNFRSNHGHFSSSADLLKTRVIDSTLLHKIEPYLAIR